MSILKSAGAVILGLAAMAVMLFLAVLFINGAAVVAEKVLPSLVKAEAIAFILCVIVLLPLSLFRLTRILSCWGFFLASFLFGLGVWMYGFMVTYDLWGGRGVFMGMVFGGVGVVPLGIIAAALKGMWSPVVELMFGIAQTFGARAFAFYLAQKLDRQKEEARLAEIVGEPSAASPREDDLATNSHEGTATSVSPISEAADQVTIDDDKVGAAIAGSGWPKPGVMAAIAGACVLTFIVTWWFSALLYP